MRQRENIFLLGVEIAFTEKGSCYIYAEDEHVRKYGYKHVRRVKNLVDLHNADYKKLSKFFFGSI